MIWEAVVPIPIARIADLPILTQAERHRLLYGGTIPSTIIRKNKCIHQLFEEQWRRGRRPSRWCMKTNNFTYRELNIDRTNSLITCKSAVWARNFGGIWRGTLHRYDRRIAWYPESGCLCTTGSDYPKDRLAFMLAMRRWRSDHPKLPDRETACS